MRKAQERSNASITFSLYPSEKEEILHWVALEKTSISNFVRNAIGFYINYLEEQKKNAQLASEEKSKSVE